MDDPASTAAIIPTATSATHDINVMLVTANVGSIFEDPDVLMKSWVEEFLEVVTELKPKFLALHCQEVGGKNYEDSMKHVDTFVRALSESQELNEFNHVKIFLDEDFSSTEKFTALGNLYFVHNTAVNWKVWDFKEHVFVPVEGQDIYSGNIEKVSLKEKDKFPKDFFPECKWSRKGFMRTRWSLDGAVFDLVNIHLFHDASNFISMESFPSPYTKTRHHALQYTLDRLGTDSYENVPLFMFGDFNFRLDTGAVVKRLTDETTESCVRNEKKGEVDRMIYKKSTSGESVLTLEKKVFDLVNQEDTFYVGDNHTWLLDLDGELALFAEQLNEFKITFPPSYPFTEDNCGTTYMKTRCPSWCDRVLFSPSAKTLVLGSSEELDEASSSRYGMMGSSVPMGDHKPIFLYFRLNTEKRKALTSEVSHDRDQDRLEVYTEEPIRCGLSGNEAPARDPHTVDGSGSSSTKSRTTKTTTMTSKHGASDTVALPASNSTQSSRSGSLADAPKVDSDDKETTRYIYVEYQDRVAVFRETTV